MNGELQANVVGGIIIALCVCYCVWILRSADKDRFPW